MHALVRNDDGADILNDSIFRIRPRHDMAHGAYHGIIYEVIVYRERWIVAQSVGVL
jgi:hypothetical protein